MIKHNKKRNTLLIYEFLTHSLVESLINDNKKKANEITNIIKEYYDKKSQLYREYKLMKALATININSEDTVRKIFEDVKEFSKNIDFKALSKEKTLLINEIHNKLNEKDFYKKPVKDYIKYATIQNLINEYRNDVGKDFDTRIRISMFEDKIRTMIQETNNTSSKDVIKIEDKKVYNNTTTRMIVKRFNEKYKSLNETQRNILCAYATNTDVINKLNESKFKIIEYIDKILISEIACNDADVNNRLNVMKENVSKYEPENTDASINTLLKYTEIFNYES